MPRIPAAEAASARGLTNNSCASLDISFTYFFFLRQQNIESLYDVISSGGDADTNGSMLAALLGALHGPDIFPNELKSGLIHKDQIEGLIDRFCAQYA